MKVYQQKLCTYVGFFHKRTDDTPFVTEVKRIY